MNLTKEMYAEGNVCKLTNAIVGTLLSLREQKIFLKSDKGFGGEVTEEDLRAIQKIEEIRKQVDFPSWIHSCDLMDSFFEKKKSRSCKWKNGISYVTQYRVEESCCGIDGTVLFISIGIPKESQRVVCVDIFSQEQREMAEIFCPGDQLKKISLQDIKHFVTPQKNGNE